VNARAALEKSGKDFELRHLLKEPLTSAELKQIASRVGGIRELVKPLNRSETEKLSDAELVEHLAKNPNHVRRPIIDSGGEILLGFAAPQKTKLSELLKKR
jgi:arsenate reductase-like glutaredoxin family protein